MELDTNSVNHDMTDPHWHRHRPSWWPENEAWPPRRPPYLRNRQHIRKQFFWRIGCGLFLLMVFALLTVMALAWLASAVGRLIPLPPNWPPVFRDAVVILFGIGLAVFVLGGLILRRVAAPVGNLLEAAGRIEGGDYSVRVQEKGPREVRALGKAFNAMASRLQTSDEQRKMLLADISHELQTPITVIQGNLEGLLDGVYPLDRSHVEAILDETRLLSRAIDDLRTLSLADSGALSMQPEASDMEELIRDLAASFEPRTAAARIHLACEIQPDLPLVEIDPVRIREVILNLLSNALRYTPPDGQILLRVWMKPAEADRIWLEVKDTGSGIAAADLPHVFDRFYKTSDSRGTGLGLAICKRLVQAHGGEITVASEPGLGTSMTFWLPVSAQVS
jgi:two-component system sensor histidine kinase BaeS